MKMGQCVPYSTRPNLSAPDIGHYTVMDPFICKRSDWTSDDKRRRDVTGSYGRGTPRVTTTEPKHNFAGLASTDERPVQRIETENGPIELPEGPIGDCTWMPTTAVLDCVPQTGSRFTAISDRYYR